MPGVSSSNRAAAASLDEPMPDIVELRGDGPKRATVGFVTSLNCGRTSADGVRAAAAGAAGAAAAAPVAGVVAEPAPEPAALAAAEPAAGAAALPAAGAF